MLKYAIVKTKGDNENILYVAESKEEAMLNGEEIAKTLLRSEGILSLERMDVDGNNNKIGSRSEIIRTWR